MAEAAVWDWFVGLPTAAERAIAIGIDDRAWLQFFELIYLKTREADGMALECNAWLPGAFRSV